jgi:hypothetical protein
MVSTKTARPTKTKLKVLETAPLRETGIEPLQICDQVGQFTELVESPPIVTLIVPPSIEEKSR